MATKNPTKAHCAELRQQLRDLGYGQAESELSETFALRLYPVAEHLRAFDPRVALVVGSRGAGKSELFRAFFEQDPTVRRAIMDHAPVSKLTMPSFEDAKWLPAYPQRTSFPDDFSLSRNVRTDQDAQRTWPCRACVVERGNPLDVGQENREDVNGAERVLQGNEDENRIRGTSPVGAHSPSEASRRRVSAVGTDGRSTHGGDQEEGLCPQLDIYTLA